ncbi:MAG: DNRLRE domain-containing protein [Clostridiales Family XIII bacterium]|jgi:hypothetical protein|nr:DNRLRE domain-containing protein [Clostridiales Family XIII bacterium]
MNMKRKPGLIATFVIVALLFTGSGVFAFADSPTKTFEAQGSDIVVTAWLSQSTPGTSVSLLKDSSYIQVGVANDGKNSVGLAHFELPAGVTAGEVTKATLLLKKKSGAAPSVKVGAATVDWSPGGVTWNEMKGKTTYAKQATLLKAQSGGWYAADVTKTVKSWLSGKTNNLGFALKGTRKGSVTAFVSAYAKNAKDYPALKITYKDKTQAKSYGKYGYTKQGESKGNCFSYAMRDTDAIFLDDILTQDQKRQFQSLSNKSAKAGLNYFKQRVFDYIDAHKKELGVESWRELSSYTKAYDPDKEYLAVMKTGFVEKGYGRGPGGAYNVDEDFDYHWRVRLNDGRWAEKLPGVASRVTPGSNRSYNAAKYPWDSNYMWGYQKFNGFYNSSPTYIAVTKSTGGFTSHKPQAYPK